METVINPDCLVGGLKGEVIALKHYSQTNITEKHCVVVYREEEGFIITAFMASEPKRIIRRGIIWRK